MLAPSSRHWPGSRVTWLEEQSAHVSWMHCHQLVQSRQEDPKDLFWDLYFFSSISKTFLPQLMLSQPGPLCRRHNAVPEGLLGRQRHSMLFSTVWPDCPFLVGRRPSRALQWQQVSRTAHCARPRTAVKQPPLRLADSDIPRVFNHTHLGVTLASNLRWDDHIDRLGGKVAGHVHLCRTLAFRHNMHGMAIRRFFVAFIRPRLEYCSAVWCGASPALLKDVEKVQLRVARAIVRNTTLQDLSTLQQARLPTLSWRRREHCLGLLWQLSIGKGPPALQASLVPCGQLRSTRFPHSFRFPSASSSRHLSSFLCQTVPIWNRLPSSVISSTSLSSFRSEVRRHFVSDMFTYGLS